ncbi:4Fe-4S dicluster domain-containing protein [Chloroflexota bacterium]
MKLSRRDFLKTSAKASAAATGLMLVQSPAIAMAQGSQTTEGMAMLIDVTKCVSCWWCYAACKNYNKLTETIRPDPEQPPSLSADTWTTLHPVKKGEGWTSRKKACNHCTNAACVTVCPTGALSYNDLGFVQYDKSKCSGCGYCAEVCPFDVPQLDANKVTGDAVMNKCTFCIDRVKNGEPTACSEACTTGAIRFGKRAELIAEGQDRVAVLSQTNSAAVLYGDKELDGLHVMYVLDDSPETYDLPANPQVPATAKAHSVFRWLGAGAALAVVAGLGLNYLIARARMVKGDSK